MRERGVKLHPKFGVNPTIAVCNWCGKDTGTVMLLGAAYKGRAPMHMVVNDEPCDKCRGDMRQGITFVEVKTEGGKERTGRWWVVRPEAVERLIIDVEKRAEVLAKRRCTITPDVAHTIGLEATSEGGESK